MVNALNLSTLKSRVLATAVVVATLLALSIFAQIMSVRSNQAGIEISRNRFLSLVIAEEFKQTSRDLTRACRTYVITGDTKHRNDYFDIVNWRAGKAPRPDYVHPELYRGQVRKQTDIMKELGFPPSELALLEAANSTSDALVATETQAMESVRQNRIFPGPVQARPGESPRQFAFRIVFDDAYQGEVAKIMAPVRKFCETANRRTNAAFEASAKISRFWLRSSLAMQVVVALAAAVTVIFFARGIVRRVQLCKDAADRIAAGDTGVVLTTTGNDEITSLQLSMQKIVDAVRKMMADTEMLAHAGIEGRLATRADASKHQGDFRKIVEGVNDTLDAVTGPLNVAADFVDRISGGEMPPPMEETYRGDFNKIRNNLNTLVATLARIKEEDRRRDWLKTGMNELNIRMRGDLATTELADRVLRFLAEYLQAGVGAFYLYHQDRGDLELVANYAFNQGQNLGDRFGLGEGLIGQAAREGKMICLTEVPHDYLPISTVIGEGMPACVIALPLLHEKQLVGALELGSFREFNDTELEFLSRAMEALAIGVSVNTSRQRVNELLEQSQAQEEELRCQQEMLQQINEELEERTKLLEEQRGRFQVKKLELPTPLPS